MTKLMTPADEAIHLFEQNLKGEFVTEYNEDESKFPHWQDIFQKITDLWQSKFEKHLSIMNDEQGALKIIKNFRMDTNKIFSKKTEYNSLKKYYNRLIDYQIEYISKEVFALIPGDQKENNQTASKINLDKFAKNLDLCKDITIQIDKLNTCMDAPPSITHMLRCHSKNNSSNDNTTEVMDAAFELASVRKSFDEDQEYTNIFATCGGYIINFIDAESGKILKRFNDNHLNSKNHREVYTKVAWTIINRKSVLVAGGQHGQVKVIMPNKNVCISRFDAHSSQIKALLFHHNHPDILLTASDGAINIWKINIIDSEETIECECSVDCLNTIKYGELSGYKKENVLSMCFIPNDYLLFSTEYNNYSVNLNDDELFNKHTNAIKNAMETFSKETVNMETNDDDIVSYLTTAKTDEKPKLTAEKVVVCGKTEIDESVYFEDIIVNKFFYINNVLLATLIDSSLIYKLRIIDQIPGETNVKLAVTSHLNMKSHTNYSNNKSTKLFFFKNNLLQPSDNGKFFSIKFNQSLTSHKYILKLQIPSDYTIKNKKDNYTIPVDSYNLCEKPTVLTSISNGDFMVSTTNQNMIIIWK